jgi:hypothetical protein
LAVVEITFRNGNKLNGLGKTIDFDQGSGARLGVVSRAAPKNKFGLASVADRALSLLPGIVAIAGWWPPPAAEPPR